MFEPLHVRAYKGFPVRPIDDIDLDASFRSSGMHEDPGTAKLDLSWIVRAIRQRWKLIAAVVLIFLIPSIVYVQLAEPIYRSTAVIQISSNSSQVLPYNDPLDPDGGINDYELTMKTYDGILKSQALRQRVIERFQESREGALVPDLNQALASNPIVERVEGSQLVSIGYLASNPTFAAAVANAWVEELIGMEADGQIKKAEEATGFLRDQLAALKVQVEQAEANLIAYARQHRILDLDANSESVVRRRLTQLTEEVTRAEANLLAQQARHGSLTRVAENGVPASIAKPVISSLEAKVFELEQELTELKGQFGDKWPAVQQKDKELELARRQLERAQTGAMAELTLDSQLALNAAVREYETLKASAEKQAALVSSLNADLVAYNALDRDFQTTNELYQSLLQRLKETAVVAGLERRRVHLMDPAVPGSEPYRPRKALTLMLALASALVLGTGMSLALQTAGDTFSSVEEVERLGVPVLGALPRVRRGSADHFLANHSGDIKLLEKMSSNGHGNGNGNGHSRGGSRYLPDEQHLLRESYRSVCSSLILSRPEGPPKKILVTSALARDGKTTTVSAVGATLAELGAKTILVDADLRNPSLSRSFGMVAGEGLSTFLSGGAVNVAPTGRNNLYLLPSGPPAPNPMALFSSARMSELLHELSKQFEFVVIDSPPVIGLADSVVLASQADGVVVVTCAGRTPRTLLRQAVSQLRRTGAVVLGAAVTQVEDRRMGYSQYSTYATSMDPLPEEAPSASGVSRN